MPPFAWNSSQASTSGLWDSIWRSSSLTSASSFCNPESPSTSTPLSAKRFSTCSSRDVSSLLSSRSAFSIAWSICFSALFLATRAALRRSLYSRWILARRALLSLCTPAKSRLSATNSAFNSSTFSAALLPASRVALESSCSACSLVMSSVSAWPSQMASSPFA